jgi:hypothetical protein
MGSMMHLHRVGSPVSRSMKSDPKSRNSGETLDLFTVTYIVTTELFEEFVEEGDKHQKTTFS